MTPRERILRARLGGLSLAATRNPLEYTGAARAAFAARFERMVDPEGTLEPGERARRAEAARRAYFTRLALQSAQTRARKQRRPGR